MFWSIDENLYNADQLLEDAQVHINRAIERNAPPEDLELLHKAFKHLSVSLYSAQYVMRLIFIVVSWQPKIACGEQCKPTKMFLTGPTTLSHEYWLRGPGYLAKIRWENLTIYTRGMLASSTLIGFLNFTRSSLQVLWLTMTV